MNDKLLIENIIYLRKSSGYTQKQLSELLNYSDKVISKWERGESIPDISAINKIAEVYKVKIDQLLNQDFSNANMELNSNDETSIKELDLNWVKGSTEFFKFSLIIAIMLYFLGVIAAFLWFEWIMFIGVSVGLMLYTILHQVIVHNTIIESDYKSHKILIKTTMSKTYLYIDNILVEKYVSFFESSFKLSGKVGDEIIKVNMSRFVSTKCSIFAE